MTPKPHRRRTIGITEAAGRELLSAAMAFIHRAGISTDAIDLANGMLDAAVAEAVAKMDGACPEPQQKAVAVPVLIGVGGKVRVTPPFDGLPSSTGEVVAFVQWAAVRFPGEPSLIHIPVAMLEVIP